MRIAIIVLACLLVLVGCSKPFKIGGGQPITGHIDWDLEWEEESKCPLCGSPQKLQYSLLFGGGFSDEYISIENATFYICAECGNVYAVEKTEEGD